MPEMPNMSFLSWQTSPQDIFSHGIYNLFEKTKETGNIKQRSVTLTMGQ